MENPAVTAPDVVLNDLCTVVFGPGEGGQAAVDGAVKRLQDLVVLGQVIDDQGIALLSRAMQMLVGDDLPDIHSDDPSVGSWDRYSALVHEIDEYMAKCPERWAK